MRLLLIAMIIIFTNSCKSIPASERGYIQNTYTINTCIIPDLPTLDEIPPPPDFNKMPNVTTQEQIDKALVDYINKLRATISTDRKTMKQYHDILVSTCSH